MNGAHELQVATDGPVVRLTLDRPPLNILGISMLEELSGALDRLPPPPEVRFLVFSGAGERAFSAGADIADHMPERVERMLETFHGVFRKLWHADWITIAQVHGHCLGGGMELAMFCDYVVASRNARFALPEINLACFPPVAAVLLPALVGQRRAMDLLLTGRSLNAHEALAMGLLNSVAGEGELAQSVDALIENLQPLSSVALTLARRAVLQAGGFDFEARLAQSERIYLDRLMRTQDALEGIRARLEKRQPEFTGR